MRRVNIRNGLKQRMNEILGTDYGTEGNVPGITAWSIQAAMISNLRRIVTALVGDATTGRPIRGLWITRTGSNQIGISEGIGLTPNGDAIVVESSLTVTLSDMANGYKYVYLKHILDVLDGDINDDGKKTGFIAKAGTENIVYDDMAAAAKMTVGSLIDQIIVISTSGSLPDKDHVYLGKVLVNSADITDVINSFDRGIYPNNPDGNLRVGDIVCENITVNDEASINKLNDTAGDLTVEPNTNFSADVSVAGDLTLGDKVIPDVGFEGVTGVYDTTIAKTFTVKKGIITDCSDSPS